MRGPAADPTTAAGRSLIAGRLVKRFLNRVHTEATGVAIEGRAVALAPPACGHGKPVATGPAGRFRVREIIARHPAVDAVCSGCGAVTPSQHAVQFAVGFRGRALVCCGTCAAGGRPRAPKA